MLLLLALLAGCGAPDPPLGRGELWLEADEMFHRDPRFIGADGAYTIDLGGDRILWLFGDSFVTRHPDDPEDSYFLRNSVAVQTGRDPSRAFLQYYWRTDDDGGAQSFFPDPAPGYWFWPGSGIRLDDTLVIFGGLLHQEGAAGPDSFGEEAAVAYLVDNPDDDPSLWTLRDAAMPNDARVDGISFGESVIEQGDLIYVFANRDPRHSPLLARFQRIDVLAGDLTRPEYWCGDRFGHGCDPAALFADGMPEYSVHYEARLGAWVYVGTSGYGATTLAWRTAPAPQGPWSDVGDVFRPPESFVPQAFVYAGKAHPELDGGDAIVATYVPSLFVDLPNEEWVARRLYFPHFARLYPE